MALEKIMPDDMNEVMCALLAYINEEHKAAGAKMSYGDFGKFLAQTYGKQRNGGNPNGCFISGTPTKVKIETSEGTKYELTWNKAAKLIHSVLCSAQKHTDEIMTPEATPIEKAGLSVKTFNEVKRTFPNAVTLGELKNFISDDPKTLDYLDNATFHELRTVLGLSLSEIAETDTPDSTAVPETVETTDTETAFDYSLIDDDTAQYLRKAAARIANSYADIGAVLAEAQERLASHDKNQGVFEKWYTSIGMKRDTVYNFIRIHNFRNELMMSSEFRRTSENALDLFDNLPKTLQSDISSPSAPAEAVNAVLSGDITTHKDFIAMKKQLEEAQAWNEKLSEENIELTGRNSSLESRAADLGQQNDLLREENEKLSGINEELDSKNNELELENKELRSQPQDAIIPPDPTKSKEYQSLKDDYNKISRLIAETTQENDRLKDKQKELLGRYNELYERAKAAADSSGRELTGYFLPVSVDEYSAICQQLKGTKYAELLYKAKLIKF